MGTLKSQLLRFTALAIFTATQLNTSPASALELDANEIRGESSKKSVSVLQNRYFLKTLRPEVGFIAGYMLDEAYTSTQSYGLRAGMFFNEWMGFEVQMQRTAVSNTADREALNKKQYWRIEETAGAGNAVPPEELTVVSPDPEVNPLLGMTDVNAIAAPFYGKLNIMNKLIIYTDLYFTAGMARVETEQGDKLAYTLGAGERFYVGQSWSMRIDFKDRTFIETRAGQESRRHALSVDLGASYFFN